MAAQSLKRCFTASTVFSEQESQRSQRPAEGTSKHDKQRSAALLYSAAVTDKKNRKSGRHGGLPVVRTRQTRACLFGGQKRCHNMTEASQTKPFAPHLTSVTSSNTWNTPSSSESTPRAWPSNPTACTRKTRPSTETLSAKAAVATDRYSKLPSRHETRHGS